MKPVSFFKKTLFLLLTFCLSICLLLTGCQSALSVTESQETATQTRQETTAEEPVTTKEETMSEPAISPEPETIPELEEDMPNPDWVNGNLKFTLIGGTRGDNDATAWGDYLFKFNGTGWCYVYFLKNFTTKAAQIWKNTGEKTPMTASFQLNRFLELAPHSNSATFGTEKYAPEDEFPLLYCNVYNNYKGEADRKEGMLCVYRILRDGKKFSSQLVQIIQVGFTADTQLWASANKKDVRPFGNFAIDRENNTLYAFTMRDEDHSTRYFSFSLPSVKDGEPDADLGINKVVLTKKDIKTQFSCDYHHYIQGAEISGDYLWSVEGRTESADHPAVLRIISLKEQKEVRTVRLADYVADIEPEVITFQDGKCYYGDVRGNLYRVQITP